MSLAVCRMESTVDPHESDSDFSSSESEEELNTEDSTDQMVISKAEIEGNYRLMEEVCTPERSALEAGKASAGDFLAKALLCLHSFISLSSWQIHHSWQWMGWMRQKIHVPTTFSIFTFLLYMYGMGQYWHRHCFSGIKNSRMET